MNIKYGKQVDISEVPKEIDIFIYAENIEKRKYTLLEFLSKNGFNVNQKLVFLYNTSEIKLDFDSSHYIIENIFSIIDLLNEKISLLKKEQINILIDYSCMTKPWYYTIMNFFYNVNLVNTKVSCFFSYSPSKFSEPLPPKQNTKIEPIESNFKIPNGKPKALIICLGYEQNKAQGIIDQLDPKITFVGYTNPGLDDKFVKTILNNNKELLDNFKQENIFEFPIDNLNFIEKELTSLYYYLREDYNIVIAPLGPKPFTLVAMVMSMIYKEIEVWRVDSGFDINKYDREPISDSEFIINEIVFH